MCKSIIGIPCSDMLLLASVYVIRLQKRKVCAVRRHDGSLCTQKQPGTAAVKAATRKNDPMGGQPIRLHNMAQTTAVVLHHHACQQRNQYCASLSVAQAFKCHQLQLMSPMLWTFMLKAFKVATWEVMLGVYVLLLAYPVYRCCDAIRFMPSRAQHGMS